MHGYDGIRISLRNTQKNSKKTRLKETSVSIQLGGYEIVQAAEPNLRSQSSSDEAEPKNMTLGYG